jgi:phosphoglycolate phosphatase-like HAD superfamily hydrolase
MVTDARPAVVDRRLRPGSYTMSALPAGLVPFQRPSLVSDRFSAPLTLPKVLLCDLDGTLIDSMPTLADLATDVLGEVYGTPGALAREFYLATCGLPFIRQLESIFPGDPRNQAASDLFEGRKPERCNQIRMPVEVSRALTELKKRGVAIVVSSNNGVENVDAFARNSGFDFDLALGFGGGLAKGKPHIDLCEATFDVDRSRMLFIGDSLHDGEIAEREAIPFVGLAGTFSYERFTLRFPDVPVLRRFGELPGLFGAEARAAVLTDGRLFAGNG